MEEVDDADATDLRAHPRLPRRREVRAHRRNAQDGAIRAANIAEGKLRISAREFRHFISIALGSAAELQTYILAAELLGYLPSTTVEALEADVEEVGRMLRGLERALEG